MIFLIRTLIVLLVCAGAAIADAPKLFVPPSETARMSFSAEEALNIECQVPKEWLSADPPPALFAAALYGGGWFAKSADARWLPWDGDFEHLPAFADTGMASDGVVELWSGKSLGAGEYLVYCGLGSAGNALRWVSEPTAFVVFDSGGSALHPFQHRQTLDAYLKKGSALGGVDLVFAPELAADQDSGSESPRVSDTNLQENGVDEADIIKVHGNHLYALADCGSAVSNTDCLRVFDLQTQPPRAPQLAEVALRHSVPSMGMYLRDDRDDAQSAQLISLASAGGWYGGPLFLEDSLLPYYPVPSSTEIAIHDLADALAPKPGAFIVIDGELVSSRRIGGTLYLVTRFSDSASFYPLPVDTDDSGDTSRSEPEQATLPGISIDGRRSDLFRSEDCFLPPSSAQQNPQASITSLLAIPLDAPADFKSVCIAGPTEAVYASTQNIYLATTRYPYQFAGDGLPEYSVEHQTDVHKFAFDGPGFAYRGSASFSGHLGWEQDKRSFRFGEHEGVLRVAASVGAAWNGTASTRVVMLRENARQTELEQIGLLEHLGKPGERLYAARFIGERGYLVTFRVTDPLYVLDLADAENPRVAGELEIAGYSDYLHPIGSDYLLGVGKDAVPDTSALDLGGRGAWYQGLKLALFDVGDPAAPVQLDSLVIGKRGTHSELLYDHHAMSYLPADGQTPARFALPVELHNGVPSSSLFDAADPRTFYDWTHTGLYVFDLGTDAAPSITERARIIAEQVPDERSYGGRFGDRSVLQDQAVHYLHAGETYSDGL